MKYIAKSKKSKIDWSKELERLKKTQRTTIPMLILQILINLWKRKNSWNVGIFYRRKLKTIY
jgi:hypothetical protein